MQDIERLKKEVIQSALLLAESRSWADITLYNISEKSGYSLADIQSFFDDKAAVLDAYGRQIDLRIFTEFGGIHSSEEAEKDRLFDVLMERFDILNENRQAVISILNSVTLDSKMSLMSLPHVFKSMSKMLDIANIATEGLMGNLKIVALTAIYIKVLRNWISDDSADMAATMASLDKALDYLNKI